MVGGGYGGYGYGGGYSGGDLALGMLAGAAIGSTLGYAWGGHHGNLTYLTLNNYWPKLFIHNKGGWGCGGGWVKFMIYFENRNF